jgi:hypothetical protein
MRLLAPTLLSLLLVLVVGKNHPGTAFTSAHAAATAPAGKAATTAPPDLDIEEVNPSEGEATFNITETSEEPPEAAPETLEEPPEPAGNTTETAETTPEETTPEETTPEAQVVTTEPPVDSQPGNETDTSKPPAGVWDPTGSQSKPATTKPETEVPTQDAVINEEGEGGNEGGTDDMAGTDDKGADDEIEQEEEEEEEEETETTEEWGNEEQEKSKVPYVPPSGEDPFDKPVDESEWVKGDQYPQETPEQMMHDQNVIIAVSVAVVFGMVVAVFSVQQVIENPDGFCAA